MQSPLRRTVFAALVLAGCAPTTNLLNPGSPRFLGSFAPATADSAVRRELRIVTFNIKFARRIDRAIKVLGNDSLRSVDVLALQEMDEIGVEQIARALKLNYAYYPSSIHPTDDKYFGPALLSRWPIERSWKLILPHAGRIRHQRRTATAALLRIRGEPLLAYAVHLETQLRISDRAREDQVLTIFRDAAEFSGPVVIAGDFNSQGIGPFLVRHGYSWVTERVGPSITIFSWDHIFVRHLTPTRSPGAGLVKNVRGASDHRPVWAVVRQPGSSRSLHDDTPGHEGMRLAGVSELARRGEGLGEAVAGGE
jgi:endonuclease/exonuclease/phosphatase family metal-dependent hydrolase